VFLVLLLVSVRKATSTVYTIDTGDSQSPRVARAVFEDVSEVFYSNFIRNVLNHRAVS
jgi:hypothetical protein